MINEGPSCRSCVNVYYGHRRIAGEGTGSSGIMLLGDSPWKTEVEAGHNFHGPSGTLLNRMLDRLGIKRDTLIVANTIQCQPPHLGWTDNYKKIPAALAAINHCEGYLKDEFDLHKPRVVVALGSVAMKRMIGLDIQADLTERHSYVHETPYGIPMIPTFHPSYLLQGKHKFEICTMFALRRAQEMANGTYTHDIPTILEDPPIDRARQWLADGLAAHSGVFNLLMVDIETPESASIDEEDLEEKGLSYKIDRAGFSFDGKTGISFPWAEPYIGLLQEAINASTVVSEWADNHFDSRRLSQASIRFPESVRILSGMWAWHFYQSDLLKGLGFVAPFFYKGPPFKHLGSSQPALYNGLDNAVGWKCTQGSLDQLLYEGRLDRFLRHCVDADKIYVRMGGMGVCLDTDHHTQFIHRLHNEFKDKVTEIQPLVPDAVKPVMKWKRRPKAVREDGTTDVVVGNKKEGRIRATVHLRDNPDGGTMAILPFNVNSAPHIKGLIKSLGLKVPRDRDGETTGAKHLKRFVKYPVFAMIQQAKQRGKLVSSYNWQVDERGRIKTTYGYHPSTLRKSSRNYNLQVIPKRSDLADEFRRSIVAADGHYLLTSDGSAIEAVLVGYDAGSDSYIRLAKAGLHGWMTAAFHGEPLALDLPFATLTKGCKAAKKKWPGDYETLKRVGHLSNYLGTPYRIFEEYPEEFKSPFEAGHLQNFYFSTEPGKEVRRWQTRVMQEAHKNNFLDNHFNYRHYFYSVYKKDPKTRLWVIDHEGDAKRAVAFRPQSDASAIQTEVILRVAEGYEKMLGWLRLIIHDEIVMEVPEDELEYAATILHSEMIRPLSELPMKDGSLLSIGAETKFGKNLAGYNADTNPNGMREMIVEEA